MDYNEALKKVTAIKPKENYLLIEISYDKTMVLPHKEGVLFLTSLANAELLEDSYGKPKRFTEFNKDMLKVSMLSAKEYQRIKIANLLKVDPKDLLEAEQVD